MIQSISPIDGRYAGKTKALSLFFSEMALIQYRVLVEVRYFEVLATLGIVALSEFQRQGLNRLVDEWNEQDAMRVKEIEKVTNHDVKAVEYFLKERLEGTLADHDLEFIHFGLTSQDINNTALPLMIKGAVEDVIRPALEKTVSTIDSLGHYNTAVAMLARTHGQPASPTSLGKELRVFSERLSHQMASLPDWAYYGKFGGATGNFNAHHIAYPDINWRQVTDQLLENLGIRRYQTTTQIAHYDDLAALFQLFIRVGTILIDFTRDIWHYISINYFTQKVVAGEVGSSAMPHKVNPIDFENAEGNLGLANALFGFLAEKLPVSRLQRDLTDSTVTRNIGVPFAHFLIALKSIDKGLAKLEVNQAAIDLDLGNAWAVVAEGIQTVLRREGYPQPYEALKTFSRGKGAMNQDDFVRFINQLDVSDTVKSELRLITPNSYTGYSTRPAE